MKRIMAFDCSTSTGYAVDTFNGVKSGVMQFKVKTGESTGIRYLRFSRWVGEMLDLYKPDIAVYEMAHHRGRAATEICVGFTTRIMEQAEARGIQYTAMHSGTIKKAATGNGSAKKEAMHARAQELFPHYDPSRDSKDFDEADALMILTAAQHELGGSQ